MSPKATKLLCETQTQLNLPKHKLIHDVPTRWNSSLDMLARFWEQQPAVLNTLLSRKLKKEEDMARLSEDDMALIQEVVKLMTPLKVATILLSEEKNPTITMISPLQAKLQKHFQAKKSDLPEISEMKRRFNQDFPAAMPISKTPSTVPQPLTHASRTWRSLMMKPPRTQSS